MNLIKHLDDLHGLRAARFVRVSTSAQADNYGPDAQIAQQDRAIERYGLVDTGLSWQLAHSGYATDADGIATIASDSRYVAMLAQAGSAYDVLLLGYSSRLGRNTELLAKTRRLLHASGAVILACDERLLSTDPQWIAEAASSEVYSARQGLRISEGQEAKWHKFDDPSGWAPLGYKRVGTNLLLAIDADKIGQVTALYKRYALGNASIDDLADARIAHKANGQPMTREGIADVLVNPIYRGEVAFKGQTAYRDDLRAMPDDLWYRVQDVRLSRVRGGGPRKPKRTDLLAGLLYCADCGTRLRSDGYSGEGIARKRHASPCASWGEAERVYSRIYEVPIIEQVQQIDLSDGTLGKVRAALSARVSPLPNDLAGRRIERQRRQLREAFDKGTLSPAAFIAKPGSTEPRHLTAR